MQLQVDTHPASFKRFREGFPALREKTYLSICDKMILHDDVRASIDVFLDHLAAASANRTEHEVKVLDDHSTMGGFDYQLQPDSRRFEVGSFNLAGAYAADSSLQLLHELGADRIEKRVLSLAAMLHEGLSAAGISPAVPGSGPEQSHILTLGELDAGGQGFSSDPLIGPLSRHLNECKVSHTIRRGQLRIGIHAYNNEQDIEHTVSFAREALALAKHESQSGV